MTSGGNDMEATIAKTNGSAHKAAAYAKTRAVPPLDMYESREEYLVVVDVPGASRDSLNVRIEGGALSFELREGETVLVSRSLKLPDAVDDERVSADVRNGVLTIHLPKRAPSGPKQIAVKSG